jgi:putative endonuclease
MKDPAVYILASKRDGILYIGVTSDLWGRMQEHRQDVFDGFTKRYGVKRLVYYEFHETMDAAIQREKRLKEWKRAWKVRLIHSLNPEWHDLYDDVEDALREGFADIARRRSWNGGGGRRAAGIGSAAPCRRPRPAPG